ncbi:hypothetical protein LR48_Vigan09g084300 [Vigna angularis]|uniref:Uncharacterized protein n=1 Tax=Phaseolus angularis TaxID=3914 RepID=A0A0L9VBZ7_PHAAN|nr:hypothetical protein LR48_Vigan09g084300 [Vigna angularis]
MTVEDCFRREVNTINFKDNAMERFLHVLEVVLSLSRSAAGVPSDLSSKDIAVMKRRIANVLEPGETVLQALRRLKGNSDRKAKMSAEIKAVFDQLIEDAMKLMENGEYS